MAITLTKLNKKKKSKKIILNKKIPHILQLIPNYFVLSLHINYNIEFQTNIFPYETRYDCHLRLG